MSLKAIGRNIRTYRKAQHMSIEELAFRAGLSKNYLALVERGEKIPSLETFIQGRVFMKNERGDRACLLELFRVILQR